MTTHRKRRLYSFTLGRAVSSLDYAAALQLASSQLRLAQAALMDAEREKALARIDAAQELLMELRSRGEQLHLL